MANSGAVAAGRAARPGDRVWFLGWVAVGGCAAFGLAVVAVPGLVLALLAAAAGWLLARKGPNRAVGGLLTGIALPVLYIGYLNRGGPGDVCHADSGGQSCVDEYSPYPFLLVGLVLLVAGAVLFVRLDRRRSHPDAPTG